MNVEVFCFDAVAPVRERGLKFSLSVLRLILIIGRSREGAWIEIKGYLKIYKMMVSRSREGAWIEIAVPEKH